MISNFVATWIARTCLYEFVKELYSLSILLC
jgi:hypothetical protein